MNGTQVGEPLASQSEVGDVLSLVGVGVGGKLKTLLGQVGAAVGAYGLLGVYVVQYLT